LIPQLVRDQLALYLPEERIAHSDRVSETAVGMAEHWKMPTDIVQRAGWGHDIAKALSPKKVLRLDWDGWPQFDSLYDDYPAIWHAFVGPLMIEKCLGWTDSEFLSCVRWHTTGRAKMSSFEQIIFVADYIEPGRSFDDRDYIQGLAKESLDLATFAVASRSILSLEKRRGTIHAHTLRCRDYYQSIVGQEDAKDIVRILINLS
jgi:predicted HD superfamily hydrolase involved in NAD metabolism